MGVLRGPRLHWRFVMDFLVCQVGAPPAEFLITLGAAERLFPAVYLQVREEIVFHAETSVALAAHKGAFPTMHAQVFCEVLLLDEAPPTLRAFVRPLSGVDPVVVDKRLFVSEAFPAIGAYERSGVDHVAGIWCIIIDLHNVHYVSITWPVLDGINGGIPFVDHRSGMRFFFESHIIDLLMVS